MANDKVSITPAAMEGHGGYNLSSRVQAGSSSSAILLLEQAARLAPIPTAPQPIVIADYGSSQGRNSLLPLSMAIAQLRSRVGEERVISIVHTDLPQNDFSGLFETLNTDPNSYLCSSHANFAMAVGRSFYEQILPTASVALAWSSWAVQWLSRAPAPIPDHVQVACSEDPETRAAYARQSAEDWQNFLLARGRELMPGSGIVILTMALDDEGEFGYKPLLHAMYGTLVEMTDRGFIQREELHRMTIPTVARSCQDFRVPFTAEGHFGELRLHELEVFHAEDHIWMDYEQHGDPREFGRQWALFSRGSVFPTLAKALHSGPEGLRTIEFFERLEAGIIERLAAKPERMLIPLARLLLVKEHHS
jgi:SAM dependent carboxyl methyltransferase